MMIALTARMFFYHSNNVDASITTFPKYVEFNNSLAGLSNRARKTVGAGVKVYLRFARAENLTSIWSPDGGGGGSVILLPDANK